MRHLGTALLLVSLTVFCQPSSGRPAQADTVYAQIERLMATDFDGAQKRLLDIVRADPRDAEALLLLGTLLERRGDVDHASDAYELVVRLRGAKALALIHNKRASAWLDAADVAIKDQKLEAARRAVMAALDFAPQDPQVRARLARSLKRVSDVDPQRYGHYGDFVLPNGEVLKNRPYCDWFQELPSPPSGGKDACQSDGV